MESTHWVVSMTIEEVASYEKTEEEFKNLNVRCSLKGACSAKSKPVLLNCKIGYELLQSIFIGIHIRNELTYC